MTSETASAAPSATLPANEVPGPGWFALFGLGGGAVLGMLLALIAFDLAGFEMGKRVGRYQIESKIRDATLEQELFEKYGHYNLDEAIRAYEERTGQSLRLRQIEEDLLRARIEATAYYGTE